MSVVFDEVVGTVTPEPMPPQSESQEQPGGDEWQTGHVREEIEKLEWRQARLLAD